jgi:hypothetical protein
MCTKWNRSIGEYFYEEEGKDEEDNVGSNGVGVLVDSGEGTG